MSVLVYRAAPPRRWQVSLNRYRCQRHHARPRNPEGMVTIGAFVQLGTVVLSLRWKRP